jgi:hypothetical protein
MRWGNGGGASDRSQGLVLHSRPRLFHSIFRSILTSQFLATCCGSYFPEVLADLVEVGCHAHMRGAARNSDATVELLESKRSIELRLQDQFAGTRMPVRILRRAGFVIGRRHVNMAT